MTAILSRSQCVNKPVIQLQFNNMICIYRQTEALQKIITIVTRMQSLVFWNSRLSTAVMESWTVLAGCFGVLNVTERVYRLHRDPIEGDYLTISMCYIF